MQIVFSNMSLAISLNILSFHIPDAIGEADASMVKDIYINFK